MSIQQQVHDRFKVFVGASIDEVDAQVREFTSASTVAAKSIGVEFVESKGRLVVSLGYRDDEAGYAARLLSHPAGVLDLESPESLSDLEVSLGSLASSAGDVICHELYVLGSGEVHAVFLAKA